MTTHTTSLLRRFTPATGQLGQVPNAPGLYVLAVLETGMFMLGYSANLAKLQHVYASLLRHDNFFNKEVQAAKDAGMTLEFAFYTVDDEAQAKKLLKRLTSTYRPFGFLIRGEKSRKKEEADQVQVSDEVAVSVSQVDQRRESERRAFASILKGEQQATMEQLIDKKTGVADAFKGMTPARRALEAFVQTLHS